MRLIDADHAALMLETNLTDKEKFEKCISVDDLITFIGQLPTIDAVPVMRCKDCIFAHLTYDGECKYCDAWSGEEPLYLDGDFYCSFGEKVPE